MRIRPRKMALLLAGLVFAGSLGRVAWKEYDYYMAEKANAEAQAIAGVPAPQVKPEKQSEQTPSPEATEPDAPAEPEPAPLTPTEILELVDFEALRAVNDEIVGWILLPDSTISYPLLQTSNNQYYLSRSWQGQRSQVGSIYLECTNNPDFSDFNTIIYGHNMLDDSMFSPLHEYKAQAYWESHPVFYIRDDAGIRTYAVFAAFEAGVSSYTYRLDLESAGMRQNLLDHSAKKNVLDTGITPDIEDRIITLSTCTGRGHQSRWVVQAVLTED